MWAAEASKIRVMVVVMVIMVVVGGSTVWVLSMPSKGMFRGLWDTLSTIYVNCIYLCYRMNLIRKIFMVDLSHFIVSKSHGEQKSCDLPP